jgi:carboxyl-terminal processing protease
VVDVEPGSEADHSGIEPGMVLASVDGQPAAERLAKIQQQAGTSSSERATALLGYYRLLDGEPGSLVRVGFTRPDGSPLAVVLKRHVVPIAPGVSSRTLPSGLVYIRIPVFDASVAKQATAIIRKNANAPGIILDVRGNPGGSFAGVLKIANNFFSRRVSFGRVLTRSGSGPSFVLRVFGVPAQLQTGKPGGQVFTGPLAVLINEGSGSGAEIFAAGMQENGRAKIVGRQSCGCVLGSVAHKVKGGGEVDISEFSIITSQGKRLEGLGVLPDLPVPLTINDLRQHRDGALEEAQRVLDAHARTN